MSKKTLVVGASSNPKRFSNKAMHFLYEKNIEFVPLGINSGEVFGRKILQGKPLLKDIHSVALYISGKHQKMYYDYIVSLKPKRVIFNPGTENIDFEHILFINNIKFMHDCTLLMISKARF